MHFVKAVRYLRKHGAIIEPTDKVGPFGRYYTFRDPESDLPELKCTPKALCSLAIMAQKTTN